MFLFVAVTTLSLFFFIFFALILVLVLIVFVLRGLLESKHTRPRLDLLLGQQLLELPPLDRLGALHDRLDVGVVPLRGSPLPLQPLHPPVLRHLPLEPLGLDVGDGGHPAHGLLPQLHLLQPLQQLPALSLLPLLVHHLLQDLPPALGQDPPARRGLLVLLEPPLLVWQHQGVGVPLGSVGLASRSHDHHLGLQTLDLILIDEPALDHLPGLGVETLLVATHVGGPRSSHDQTLQLR